MINVIKKEIDMEESLRKRRDWYFVYSKYKKGKKIVWVVKNKTYKKW